MGIAAAAVELDAEDRRVLGTRERLEPPEARQTHVRLAVDGAGERVARRQRAVHGTFVCRCSSDTRYGGRSNHPTEVLAQGGKPAVVRVVAALGLEVRDVDACTDERLVELARLSDVDRLVTPAVGDRDLR